LRTNKKGENIRKTKLMSMKQRVRKKLSRDFYRGINKFQRCYQPKTCRLKKRVFGPKKEELTRGWRKLHNEIHNLYSYQML